MEKDLDFLWFLFLILFCIFLIPITAITFFSWNSSIKRFSYIPIKFNEPKICLIGKSHSFMTRTKCFVCFYCRDLFIFEICEHLTFFVVLWQNSKYQMLNSISREVLKKLSETVSWQLTFFFVTYLDKQPIFIVYFWNIIFLVDLDNSMTFGTFF